MIAIGTTFQGVIVYTDNNVNQTTKQKDVVERRNTDEKSITTPVQEVQSSITCYLSSQGNANGTNYESYLTYNFINAQLKSVTKIFMLDRIQGNDLGDLSMKNFYAAYQALERNNGLIGGYSIVTAPRGDFGFQVTTQIDLTKLDLNAIPENYQANEQIKVDFPLDTSFESVKNTVESVGYTCTLNPTEE